MEKVKTTRLSITGNIVRIKYDRLPNPHRLKENGGHYAEIYLSGTGDSHEILLRHHENITRGDSKSVKVNTGVKRVK